MEEVASGKKCTCGYEPGGGNPAYIKPGSVLALRYVVGRLLRSNGESGFYIGFDKNIQKKIWIKEYFPHSLADRNRQSGQVVPRNGLAPQYKALMSDFIELCALTKRLGKSGSVVPASQIFEENNTAYAVFPYMSLISLESHLAHMQKNTLSYAETLKFLDPLFSTVQKLHDMGGIHRGISPYTIYVNNKGKLYLGDFLVAAARTDGSELEAELYNGYSAPEQYAANRWQGAWTDVYALGALVYRMISGSVPPKSTLLREGRTLPALSELAPEVPDSISDAVAAAMTPDPEQRTQTVVKFAINMQKRSAANEGHTAVFDTSAVTGDTGDDDDYYDDYRERKPATFKFLTFALLLTVAVLMGFLWLLADTFGILDRDAPAQVNRPSPRPGQVASPTDNTPTVATPAAVPADTSVPRFIGRPVEEIEADESYGERFILDFRDGGFSDTFLAGEISDQQPAAGTPMPNRGRVILYVSKGPLQIEVPNLVGLDINEAMETLFEIEREQDTPPLRMDVFEMFDPNVDEGLIIRTDPAAGEYFSPDRHGFQGSGIQVFISMGWGDAGNNNGDDEDDDIPPPPPPPIPGTVVRPSNTPSTPSVVVRPPAR
jgi:serine/threonine-protein kinase